jgi:hypothetical protein
MAHSLPLILLLIAQAKPAEITEIRLQRTPCFGKCPVDEVALRADGTATYVGKKFVDRLGQYEGEFARADFDKLAKMLVEKMFFDLKDDYDRLITDQASIVTSARRGEKTKKIRNYANAGPEELRAIEAEVLRISKGIAWKKADVNLK